MVHNCSWSCAQQDLHLHLWPLKHTWNVGWRDEWFQGLKDTFLRVYVLSSLFTHFLEQNKFQEVVMTVIGLPTVSIQCPVGAC